MERVVIGNAELWHGDCREVLPHVSADACVADPPYGIGYVHSGGGIGVGDRRNHGVPIHGDDQPFDPEQLLRFPTVLMFGADHFRSRLPDGGTFIAWDKSCGIARQTALFEAAA